MKYVRVERILPENLIIEIQKYIQGEYIYIFHLALKQEKSGERNLKIEII